MITNTNRLCQGNGKDKKGWSRMAQTKDSSITPQRTSEFLMGMDYALNKVEKIVLSKDNDALRICVKIIKLIREERYERKI